MVKYKRATSMVTSYLHKFERNPRKKKTFSIKIQILFFHNLFSICSYATYRLLAQVTFKCKLFTISKITAVKSDFVTNKQFSLNLF